MKKAYDIKIKDLEEILSFLQSNMLSDVVVSDVIRLTEYIKRLKRDFKTGDYVTTFEQLQDDLEYYEFYKPFYPITKRFTECGRTLDNIKRPSKYKSIIISDEQVMSDVEEFYSSQGNVFSSLFQEYKMEAEDHLKFIKESPDTEGETLFIKSIGEAFVFSPNYSNITKFTIAIHEIQHVLDFFANPAFSEEFILRETVAMFMEMIATDFVVKKYKLYGENYKRLQFLHFAVKSQAHNINQKMNILSIARKNNISEQGWLKLLNDEGYEKEEIDFYFEQGITVDFAYQISYLISIELYTLYKRDKDLTLAICNDLIMNSNSSNIFDILNKYGIELNRSVVNYEKRIYKKRY